MLEALDRQSRPAPRFDVVVVDAAAPGELGVVGALDAAASGTATTTCVFLPDGVIPGPGLVAAHVAVHERDSRLVAVGSSPPTPGSLDLRDLGGTTLSIHRDALDDARAAEAVPGAAAAPVAELVLRLRQRGYEVLPVDDGARRTTGRPSRGAFAQSAAEGAAHALLAETYPVARRWLLGWFPDTTPRAVVLRRALLSLHASPLLLATAVRLAPGPAAKQRWSGFALGYAYWHGVRRQLPATEWKQLARGTPVLLYHAFGAGAGASRFVVSPRSLSIQLRMLALLRYRAIGFDELAQCMQSGTPVPLRTVVLTADDGYADNDALAKTAARHGFRATIFLVSDRLGGRVDWTDDEGLRDRPLLSHEEIQKLQRDGVEFGAHTRTHVSLPDATDAAVEEEVAGSRLELERTLSTAVPSFAYPFGRLDGRAVAAVRRAGFTSACTVEGRLARLSDDPLRVPRIEIERSDSLLRFLLKVWFGAA